MSPFFVLLFVIVPFVFSARIATDVCDVASLSDLVEIKTKANMERIACEAGQFNTYDCPKYWMVNYEVERKQFSYEACSQRKRGEFRTWAGTRQVNGAFQNDYASTLNDVSSTYQELSSLNEKEKNLTLTLVLKDTFNTRENLTAVENADALSDRVNSFAEQSSTRDTFHSQDETTRDLLSEFGNLERDLVQKENEETRNKAEEDGNLSRTTFSDESISTRNYDSNQEQDTREFTSSQSQETRDYDSEKESEQRRLVELRGEEVRALVNSEESNTRNDTSSQTHDTRSYESEQEATTRAYVKEQHDETRTLIAENHNTLRSVENSEQNKTSSKFDYASESTRILVSETSSSNDWATVVVAQNEGSTNRAVNQETEANNTQYISNVSAGDISIVVNAHQNETMVTNIQIRSQDQPTNDNIAINTNRTQNAINEKEADRAAVWSGAADNILAALIGVQQGIPDDVFNTLGIHMNIVRTAKTLKPSADFYSRPTSFEQLRSVVNDTITFNQRYGNSYYSQLALSFWSSGEYYRNRADYRTAVIKYSIAYVNAAYDN